MNDQVLDHALMTNYSQSTFTWTVANIVWVGHPTRYSNMSDCTTKSSTECNIAGLINYKVMKILCSRDRSIHASPGSNFAKVSRH